MAGKRKPKRTTTTTSAREDVSKPSKWRLQHGDFNPPSHDTDPETGTVVVHRRAVDTLGQMLANGTITQEMHDAGALFRTLFRRAALDAIGTSPLVRLPGKTAHGMTEHQVEARLKVAGAIDVLGGHDSAAGSCAWHVLGCECSVREWAQRQGWGGRPVLPPQAQGMLVATLCVLAAHFGLSERPRAA